MDILSYPILLGALAVLIVLHIVSLILHGMGAKLVSYVNIALHVAFLFPLAYYKIRIEEAVLCYLVSVFSYTLAATVHHYVISRRAAKAAEAESAVTDTVESDESRAAIGEEKGGDAE